jgi:hypothetical protein
VRAARLLNRTRVGCKELSGKSGIIKRIERGHLPSQANLLLPEVA